MADTTGPIIVLLHGYKYHPGHPDHCPHQRIFALHPNSECARSQSWPRRLGFGTAHTDEGLAVAFGWQARGSLADAWASAGAAGRALADALKPMHAANPDRPIHMIAHSMGAEVALGALEQMPAGSVNRIISMTGACHHDRTLAALDSPAGRSAEFINMVSGENRIFDVLFDRLIAPRQPRDRSVGHGLSADNAVTLRIDDPDTLAALARIGAPLAAPSARICHWSSYTRPGIMRFYNALLRRPDALPLGLLQSVTQRPAKPRRLLGLAPLSRPNVAGSSLGQMS